MSFFKRNKSKTKKAKFVKKQDQSELEEEIATTDGECYLDIELKKLTAQLNMPDESTESTEVSNSVPPEGLKKDDFIADSLKGFVTPNLTTNITNKTKTVDVTTSSNCMHEVADMDTHAHLDETSFTEAKFDRVVPDIEPIETENTDIQDTTAQDTDDLPEIDSNVNLTAPNRLNIGAVRLDVAKISADIQSGEEIYRRALQRVEGLMGFVEKAEVDFYILSRLESENRRLKAHLHTSQSEVKNIKDRLALISADLEDHRNRLAEKTSQYEEARSTLIAAAKSLKEYKQVLQLTKAESERYALAVERHKTALGIEGRENKFLREKIVELSQALELRQANYLEASKMVESLRSDCADLKDQSEAFRAEAQDLRIKLNTAKQQNNAMKGEMTTLHEDIKNSRTQYAFNMTDRKAHISDLESQVVFLAKELDAKTELSNLAMQDIARLRSIRDEQEIERDHLKKQLAAAQEKIKDIPRLTGRRHFDKLNALHPEIKDLKTELIQREEAGEHAAQDTAILKHPKQILEMERDELQSRLDLQSEQLRLASQNNIADELQTQIDKFSQELEIKDSIVQSAFEDVSDLRKQREAQDRENKRLEDLIENQTYQLEAEQKALLISKQTKSELDQKYKCIAAALSTNQEHRSAETKSNSPDIKPDIPSDFNDLSGDDIAHRIMDYKLGI